MLTEQDEYFALFPGKTLGETDSGAKSEQESISAGKTETEEKETAPVSEPTAEPFADSGDIHESGVSTFDDDVASTVSQPEEVTANEPELLASVGEKLTELSAEISTIKSQISRLASYDTAVDTLKRSLAANQATEKKLYQEVEEYKRGTYFNNIRPLLSYIIEMHCEMKATMQEYLDNKEAIIRDNNENVFSEICKLLEFYICSFENQLKYNSVSIIDYEPGTEYIAIYQRISKTIKTTDAAQNGRLAKVVSGCYMYDSTVLRPARVHVYKL